MTVIELIKPLKDFPENAEVRLLCSYDEGYGHTGGTPQFFELEDNVLYICNEEG